MARVLVQLKLRLVLNALRSSTAAQSTFIVSTFFALVVAVGGFNVLALFRGLSASVDLTTVIFTAFALGWLILPIFAFGLDGTLDPATLALYPLRTRPLAVGLLAASATGAWPAANPGPKQHPHRHPCLPDRHANLQPHAPGSPWIRVLHLRRYARQPGRRRRRGHPGHPRGRSQAGALSPLSERKLATMFGKTSRRWARNRMAEASQASISTAGAPAAAGSVSSYGPGGGVKIAWVPIRRQMTWGSPAIRSSP
jgi:hypothetical protein